LGTCNFLSYHFFFICHMILMIYNIHLVL
jgi:hypothetical protein